MKKKDSKDKVAVDSDKEIDSFGTINNSADLKAFLHTILDKMSEEIAAPIYAVTAMNYLMNMPEIYDLLEKDNEAKELARDIWLRLKASGLQLRKPPLLFGNEILADGKAA